jgi:hypothetical protein
MMQNLLKEKTKRLQTTELKGSRLSCRFDVLLGLWGWYGTYEAIVARGFSWCVTDTKIRQLDSVLHLKT